MEVLVDEVRPDGVALARSWADAPEIDGQVQVTPGGALKPGQMVKVRIDRADAFDLFATPTDLRLRLPTQGPARMHRVISRA
jgi:ribosomal protein S12 methylthiotransferase